MRFGRLNRWFWHEGQLGWDRAAKDGDPGREDMQGKESDAASILQACSFSPKIYVAIHLNLMVHSFLTK